MKIAVASGKGGTGKTTVSINLYHYIQKYINSNVMLVDCDVEEPNDALFFPHTEKVKVEQIDQQIPEINTDKCNFCRKCADWCEFKAITIVAKLGFAEINPDLCHSCGACIIACNTGAITEKTKPLGLLSHFVYNNGEKLTEGRLKVGSSMQTLMIKETKKKSLNIHDIIIFDAPPGTSCPVVETVSDADYVILVTEPTPFGLHDLKITTELLHEMKKNFGVIINKAGLGNNDVYNYLNSRNIKILGEIQFSAAYAKAYASGNLLKNVPENMQKTLNKIVEQIISDIKQ
jgi:MinD superfamily P-loop ATPase